MPLATAVRNWATTGPLATAESWQGQGLQVHVTVDTPGGPTDDNVAYHMLDLLDSHTFPAGVSVSYRSGTATTTRISRQPVG